MLEINDLMRGFVDDCHEHLDHIETALMDMEAAGANADLELVNSVFRAAHSIKGGAGMLGLDNIKTLSHKLENVLHMARNAELVPNHENITVLLKGFDKLTELIDNVDESETMPIDDQVQSLMALASGGVTNAPSREPERIDVGGSSLFIVDPLSLEQARAGGNYLYLLEYDLIHDIHGKDSTPLEMLKALSDTGRIVDCKVDFKAVGGLDDFGNTIPFYVLYASILEPKYVCGLVNLPEERVRNIEDVPEAVQVRVAEHFREEFGSVVLEVHAGKGSITLAKEINSRALLNLKVAMLAALARCTELALDLNAVRRCDLLFFQLLCAAHHTFQTQGKRLVASKPLSQEHLDASHALGFGCGGRLVCPFRA